MKKILIFLLLGFFTQQLTAINYYTGTYQEALKKSKEENKYIFLFFTAPWCGYCNGMKKFILSDTYVSNYIDENYISLQLNYDLEENKKIYNHYFDDGGGIPKFLIINGKEEVLKRQNGASKLKPFIEFLKIPEGQEPIKKITKASEDATKIKCPKKLEKLFYNVRLSRIKPGIRMGMNFNNFHSSPSKLYDDYRTGYHFGVTAQYIIKRTFQMESGLFFSSQGARQRDITYRLNYLELPLNAAIALFPTFSGNRLYLNLIPYGAVGVGGKYKSPQGNHHLQYGNQPEKIKRWDYGVKTALTAEAGTFELSLGYRWGLHDLSNQPGIKLYNRGFYFSLGMNLGK